MPPGQRASHNHNSRQTQGGCVFSWSSCLNPVTAPTVQLPGLGVHFVETPCIGGSGGGWALNTAEPESPCGTAWKGNGEKQFSFLWIFYGFICLFHYFSPNSFQKQLAQAWSAQSSAPLNKHPSTHCFLPTSGLFLTSK